MSTIYQLINKSDSGKQSTISLQHYTTKTKNLFANKSHNTYDNSIIYQYITMIHEAFLIKLETRHISILIDILDDQQNTNDKNAIDQTGQRLVNLLSNRLIGLSWDQVAATNISELELCEIMWLIQSQAYKCGLAVVDHAGYCVDVSEQSLTTTLKELANA